jgi:hypothetical protein
VEEEMTTVDAHMIEPPLGGLTLEVSDELVLMRFSDGDIEAFPRSAVRAIDRDGLELTVHWAGTPVVVSFDSTADSARLFDLLGGFDLDDRTFTFLFADADLRALKLGVDSPLAG